MKAIICHSGGIDSTVTLKLAIDQYGSENVLSLGFDYGQRHHTELDAAQKIAAIFGVQREIVSLPIFRYLSDCALVNENIPLAGKTLVTGRNGLMAWHAALVGASLGASTVGMGILAIEGQSSGYRDCSREYMDRVEEILCHDLANSSFRIWTPLVHCTKTQVLEKAQELGILEFVLEHTVSCYEGRDCGSCLSCVQRNEAITAISR